MNKIKYIGLSLLVLCGLAFTSCERDYDDPKPFVVYQDSDFADSGEEIIPIQTLLDTYHTEVGSGGALVKGYQITKDWVIKGKVISTDEYGNVYRTMYVQDASVDPSEAAAIEVKTGLTGFYNYFRPGETVYIRCKGLYLGNYRYMISLGAKSVDDTKYSNGFIDVKPAFSNEKDKYTVYMQGASTVLEQKDTLVVTDPSQLSDKLLGRLIRFEGLTHKHTTIDRDVYPSFLEQVSSSDGSDTKYTNYSFDEAINAWKKYRGDLAIWEAGGQVGVEPEEPVIPEPGNYQGATYGFKNSDKQYNYFGSALMKFGTGDAPENNLVLRTSGYAKFANNLLPADGQKVNITAIYTKHSAKDGRYESYQLMINSVRDVELVK